MVLFYGVIALQPFCGPYGWSEKELQMQVRVSRLCCFTSSCKKNLLGWVGATKKFEGIRGMVKYFFSFGSLLLLLLFIHLFIFPYINAGTRDKLSSFTE